jgi:hypothetical protein
VSMGMGRRAVEDMHIFDLLDGKVGVGGYPHRLGPGDAVEITITGRAMKRLRSSLISRSAARSLGPVWYHPIMPSRATGTHTSPYIKSS